MESSERKKRPRRRGCLICLLLFVLVVLVLLLCVPTGPKVPGKAALQIECGVALAARPRSGFEELLLGPGAPSVPELFSVLREAARDRRVRAVCVDMGSQALSFADACELHALLGSLKTAGKNVIAYADTLSLRSLWAASAAQRVVLNPAGALHLTGVGINVLLFGDLLKKLGVEAQLFRVGRVKTAYETFTSSELSEESRAVFKDLIEKFWGRFLAQVAAARRIEGRKLRALCAQGSLSAEQARAGGLVDELLYRSGLSEYAERLAGSGTRFMSWRAYKEAVGRRREGRAVGYVPLTGTILSGRTRQYEFTAADWAVRLIGELAADRSIAGIVLRVDSPGGDAYASARLYHAVREARKRKPVVVSMGEVAASGGYYVAAGATAVVAHPFTLTGSIGVFGGKVCLSGTLRKLGVRVESFRQGKYAGLFDVLSRCSAEEASVLKRELTRVYDRFVADVAQGRKLSRDQALEVADGRIMLAGEALRHHLIDGLGGLPEAIERVCAAGKVKGPVHLRVFPPGRTWYQELFEAPSAEVRAGGRALQGVLRRLLGARVLALSPYCVLWQ